MNRPTTTCRTVSPPKSRAVACTNRSAQPRRKNKKRNIIPIESVFCKKRAMVNEQIRNRVIKSLLQYHPEKIGIFGSYARGENRKDSDLDILISFKDKVSLLRLVQIEQKLSDELGIKVDLITENGLKNPRLKNFIYKDLITIFDEKERPDLS